MSKFIIDTETGTCTPYKETAATAAGISKTDKMIAVLCEHRGDVEYTGLVETIQKWFYGSLVKDSWCATTVSYLLAQVGIQSVKTDNVKIMLDQCKESGAFTVYDRGNLPTVKRGDILFWLWFGNIMTTTSSKHVGLAEYDATGNTIYCIGGNQKNKICTLAYDRSKLYAIARLKEV